MAQSIILLSTQEFRFLELSDQFKTGSSIMPQKKNPCTLEVIKAKSAVAKGMLMSLLSIGQAGFIGYNRDSQWSKYLIMDLIYECKPSIKVMKGLIEDISLNESRMKEFSTQGFVGATAVLEGIVRDFGLSFRKAKFLIEKAVKYSQDEGLESISISAMNKALKEDGLQISLTEQRLIDYQDPLIIIKKKNVIGGPGFDAMTTSIERARNRLKNIQDQLNKYLLKIKEAKEKVSKTEEELGI
jgi:argininosuccinate lyase